MTSKSFARAKRIVGGGAKRAAYCKTRRSREERRTARRLLHLDVEDLAPVLSPRHHTGAAAWWIA